MARLLLRKLGGLKQDCSTSRWQPATRLGLRGCGSAAHPPATASIDPTAAASLQAPRRGFGETRVSCLTRGDPCLHSDGHPPPRRVTAGVRKQQPARLPTAPRSWLVECNSGSVGSIGEVAASPCGAGARPVATACPSSSTASTSSTTSPVAAPVRERQPASLAGTRAANRSGWQPASSRCCFAWVTDHLVTVQLRVGARGTLVTVECQPHVTFRHCIGLPLPLALLPTANTPGTASMP